MVSQIAGDGLELPPGATILIGRNGSGKSTLIEALAAVWGRRITAFRQDWVQQIAARPLDEDSDLHRALRLDYTSGGSTGGLFFRAERLHAQAEAFTKPGRWGERLGASPLLGRSHGEGFREVLAGMTAEPGLYILDEPEAALSFDSSLVLVTLMSDMVKAGSQLIVATHSPILAALPGAVLLQLDEQGIHSTSYDECDLVAAWRSFMDTPENYVRYLT